MTTHRRATFAALVAVALALPGGLIVSTAVRADDATQVVIKTFKYGPKDITVSVGTTVTWLNKDNEVHTVVSKNGKFRSSALDTDDSFTFTFTEPGTYAFFCSLHPQMTGTVTVVAKE
jgi:plastocyanin